jgi:hypothetical protein
VRLPRLSVDDPLAGARKARARLKPVSLAFAAILGLPFIVFSAWGACFGFKAAYACLALLAFAVFLSYRKPSPVFIAAAIALFLAINLALAPDTLRTYDARRISWFAKVREGKGLRLHEKLGIYGLNAVMALFALPFSPEASRETFFLMFPARNGARRFEGSFFLRSEKALSALKARRGREEVLVSWSVSEYALGNAESRCALALNPCFLSVAEEDGRVFCSARVRVEYPSVCEVVLLEKPLRIVCQEGLFGYLQKIGWLHPYDAVWIAEYRQ